MKKKYRFFDPFTGGAPLNWKNKCDPAGLKAPISIKKNIQMFNFINPKLKQPKISTRKFISSFCQKILQYVKSPHIRSNSTRRIAEKAHLINPLRQCKHLEKTRLNLKW